jgi:dTMP kinase
MKGWVMSRTTPGGLLVVIEGIDGAGKSTQCARIVEWLASEGWDVIRLREPTDGPFGRRIRELARSGRENITPDEELNLFVEDRRENVRDNIRPALERGAIVVLDRYYYSTIAYQGANGMDPVAIRNMNEAFAPPADVLLYLTIPAELAAERIEKGRGQARDLFESTEYLRKVKDGFDAMTDPQMVRIDATADADTVFAQSREAIAKALEARNR